MTRAASWWAVSGAALALTQRVLEEHFWVVASLPLLVWAIGGLVLLGIALSKVRSAPSRPQALRAGGIVLAALILFFPTTSVGAWATERLRFMRDRSTYERIVAEARDKMASTSPHEFLEEHGLNYAVDPGSPFRVAFLWPGGILDNWCGAVFDPSGEVMGINELALGTTAWRNHRTTRLFGGDMTSCRPLDELYYLCCFT